MATEIKHNSGRPLSEEELKEWKKAFNDIEESIRLLNVGGKNESSKNKRV